MGRVSSKFFGLQVLCIAATLVLWACVCFKEAFSVKSLGFQDVLAIVSGSVTVFAGMASLLPVTAKLMANAAGQWRMVVVTMAVGAFVAMPVMPGYMLYRYDSARAISCVVQPPLVQDAERVLSDSGLVFMQSGVPAQWEITRLGAKVKSYRSDLLGRILNREGIDTACQPVYVHQIDSLGEDALWVLYKRLNTLDLIAAALNEAILSNDMRAVDAVFHQYNIPEQAELLHYESGRLAVLGSLRNYLEACFAGLDPSVTVQARLPADFLHTSYRNDAIIYIAQ